MFGAWAAEDDGDKPGALSSYAAGYPEAQDLYFLDTAEIGDDGVVSLDDQGGVRRRGVGLLVRWEQVIYAEFMRG